MKTKNNKKKSRRNFLQSTGLTLAGFSLLPTTVLSTGNKPGTGKLASGYIPGYGLQSDGILPPGVRAVWDIHKAYHETTPTREKICINGLWQFQPASTQSQELPDADWGYYKVPGSWPTRTNGRQRNNQRVYPHPNWKDVSLDDLMTAWYRREISIPAEWKKRRIILRVEYINSGAEVFIDGKKAGDLLFPAGELDLTQMCKPGKKYFLSMKVTAFPLQDVVAIFNDSNAPRQGKGFVSRRGLCGDVYLMGLPAGEYIGDIQVLTSVRRSEITFNTELQDLKPDSLYLLRAVIIDKGNMVAEFTSRKFKKDELREGYYTMIESWKPDKFWDVHTPQNMYELSVSLLKDTGQVLDIAIPEHFGFRELWIDGKDFYMNGTRFYISLCPLDNTNTGVSWSTYEMAKESMLRLMSFGINLVHTRNFGCEPGVHLSFEEVLKAADEIGMLIALPQPHFAQYDWTAPDAEQNNGYIHHARWYTRVAHNHPSVVFYPTSHNSTGYSEDMNPDKTDGIANPRSQRAQETADRARRAEAIIRRLDPGRIVYHHSSGNLGVMHTSNFYSNWLAIQEMEDWFEHWATHGVKPMMMVEFGSPWTMDWATYKGWYKGRRSFGTEPVPWEFCIPEWDSQFLGDQAYRISDYDKANIRWEAERFHAGEVWRNSDIPYSLIGDKLGERDPVWAMHIGPEWRAFRAWGVSGNCAYNDRPYWHLRPGVYSGPKEFPTDWENLQKPGYSPDYTEGRLSRLDLDPQYDRSDWVTTPASEAIIRNNRPLLAYIAGKPSAFTSKDHNFLPGTKFEKQLLIINNSREDVTCECTWSLNLPEPATGNKTFTMSTGQQERIPLSFTLPDSLKPGNYEITATVEFSNGETQKDTFAINVLSPMPEVKNGTRTALYDPRGETRKLLDEMGFPYQPVNPGADISGFEMLIIGKEALTAESPGFDAGSVKDGLKIIMFEQTSVVLEKRFGFRVQEQGIRIVHRRIADHPLLDGLETENLHDWQGSATILPPRLKVEMNDRVFAGAPTVKWCDITVSRIWRCGNRGNVASVLIEKPACGDFLPVTDCGYSLQYSPLMEYREGKGMVLFCQMDVTGRTEKDPAAGRLMRNILSYVSGWKPGIKRQAVYAGDAAGKSHLEKTGLHVVAYGNKKLSPGQVLIAGPGSREFLSAKVKTLGKWMKSGGQMLAVGFSQEDADALLPFKVTMKKEEHIAAYFDKQGISSAFAGAGPSDVHNRDPREIPLVVGGANITGNGVLAVTGDAKLVFCQLVPWECDYSKEKHNVKQTFRRWSFLLSRILGNMGVESSTPLLERFSKPLDAGTEEKRWLSGLYLDEPEEYDDPYRFFRW